MGQYESRAVRVARAIRRWTKGFPADQRVLADDLEETAETLLAQDGDSMDGAYLLAAELGVLLDVARDVGRRPPRGLVAAVDRLAYSCSSTFQ